MFQRTAEGIEGSTRHLVVGAGGGGLAWHSSPVTAVNHGRLNNSTLLPSDGRSLYEGELGAGELFYSITFFR